MHCMLVNHKFSPVRPVATHVESPTRMQLKLLRWDGETAHRGIIRVSRIDACCTRLGTRITVLSLIPSRMGIIASRRSKSKPAVVFCSFAGFSLGNAGYVTAGVWLAAPRTNNAQPAVRASSKYT
jgi:hypothetical protein